MHTTSLGHRKDAPPHAADTLAWIAEHDEKAGVWRLAGPTGATLLSFIRQEMAAA